jgi:hypothetical protein
VVARVDVTAVQARVLPGDRQAQAAALGTPPRRVGLVEPVKYVRDRGEGQPVAVVSYFHGQLPAVPAVWLYAGLHGHRRAAMTQGVADEIGEDDIEAAAVQPCGQPGGHVSAHVEPAPRSQAPADGVRDIGFIGD